MSVSIERTDEAIVIKLPLDTDPMDLQQILNYFEYINLVSKSKATQKDIDEISRKAKSGWWEANKDRFIGKQGFEGLE